MGTQDFELADASRAWRPGRESRRQSEGKMRRICCHELTGADVTTDKERQQHLGSTPAARVRLRAGDVAHDIVFELVKGPD